MGGRKRWKEQQKRAGGEAQQNRGKRLAGWALFPLLSPRNSWDLCVMLLQAARRRRPPLGAEGHGWALAPLGLCKETPSNRQGLPCPCATQYERHTLWREGTLFSTPSSWFTARQGRKTKHFQIFPCIEYLFVKKKSPCCTPPGRAWRAVLCVARGSVRGGAAPHLLLSSPHYSVLPLILQHTQPSTRYSLHPSTSAWEGVRPLLGGTSSDEWDPRSFLVRCRGGCELTASASNETA